MWLAGVVTDYRHFFTSIKRHAFLIPGHASAGVKEVLWKIIGHIRICLQKHCISNGYPGLRTSIHPPGGCI